MACSANSHELSFRSRLGKAAAIGGLKRVNEVARQDLPKVLAAGTDTDAVLQTFRRVSDRAEKTTPRRKAPSAGDRNKVDWTDDLIDKLKRHAPWTKCNKALAAKLGLPAYCSEGVRHARRKHAPQTCATQKATGRRQIESLAADLRRAA